MTGGRPATEARRTRATARWTLAAVGLIVLVLAGCGNGTARLNAQKAVLDYQSAIGRINTDLASSPAVAEPDTRALRAALARYRAVVPPQHLRALHAELISALRARIRATSRARRALVALDRPAVRAELVRGARAQRRLNRELRRLSTVATRCRRNRSDC